MYINSDVQIKSIQIQKYFQYYLKFIMISLNDLIQAFDDNHLFAWELLHAEIMFDAVPVNTDHLKNLITLYSKGLQKFNSFRLPNENYFKLKITQLMSQKKVLNCLHTDKIMQKKAKTIEQKIQTLPLETKVPLQQQPQYNMSMQLKKQQFDLRITYDIEESKKNKIGQMINQQKVKIQKVKDLVKKCLEKEEYKLHGKISKRKARASNSATLSYIMKLEESCISTFGEGIEDSRDNQTILNDLSFINDFEKQM